MELVVVCEGQNSESEDLQVPFESFFVNENLNEGWGKAQQNTENFGYVCQLWEKSFP